MDNDRGKKQFPIKRIDIGIAGSVIVLVEMLSNVQSSRTMGMEMQKFKDEFQESLLDREEFFVRKEEIGSISQKLDKMNDSLVQLNNQVISLRSFLKTKYGYSVTDKRFFNGMFESSMHVCYGPKEDKI